MWQAVLPNAAHSMLFLLLLVPSLPHAAALYHTSSEVLHWFSQCAAKRPETLRFRELREPQSGTVLPVATLSQGINGINGPSCKHKPAVLFVFGEHAREVITPEVGIWLARMLVNTNASVYDWPELAAALDRAQIDASGRSVNSSSSSSGGGGARQQSWPGVLRGWVRELLRVLEVVIVPIEALDSRRQVESGQLCVRKSASNVDLNRNWPYAWRQESASDEQYGGPNPFSEPQSRLMKHLVDHLTGRLLGYVNVHSGEWALYTPWDSKPAYGPGLPADLPDLVAKVGRLCDCKAGPAGAVSGYLAYGTSMDYLYVHKRVPYPLTVEVYGEQNIGKLSAGEANKLLTAWPTVTKTGAPIAASAEFQHRRLQAQQQQQQQQQGSSWRRSLAGWLKGHAVQGQWPAGRELQQQLEQHTWRRRRHRRHSQLQQVGTPAAEAGVPSAVGATVGASAPAAAAGFSAGANLDQLRLHAQQQQQQEASRVGSGSALSLPTQPAGQQQLQGMSGLQRQQQGAAAADALLATVAAAAPVQRHCFEAFNPPTEEEYRRVVADWLAASLIMMKHMVDGDEGRRLITRAASACSRGGSNTPGSGISIHQHRITNSSSHIRDLLAGSC